MSTSKKSTSSRPTPWWTAGSTRSRLTGLGAVFLVIGLLTSGAVIWVSPVDTVKEAVATARTVAGPTKAERERNALAAKVEILEKQLSKSKSNLTLSNAQVASLQQQLWSVQGKLDASGTATAKPKAATPTRPKTTTKAAPAAVAPVAAPTKAQIVSPTSRYFGMFTQQAPFNWASYDATASAIGSKPNSVGYFGGWDQAFRPDVVTAAWKRNTLPILTWESRPINDANNVVNSPAYSLPNIIAGNFDAYLRQYADAIVANGLPMGIRLDHEMNGTWYPWSETDGSGNSINGNNVGDYVKMWQHVHDIFDQEGANNLVVWIWAPNIVNNLPASHKTQEFTTGLYPGDAYVDEVGLSGYLRPPYATGNNFTFDYTFGASLAQLRALTPKPIYLAEVGASETGGHKVAWITSFFQALSQPANADIVGFSWFNLAVTSYTQGQLSTNDWRIDSRPDSLAAFSAGLAIEANRFSLVPAP